MTLLTFSSIKLVKVVISSPLAKEIILTIIAIIIKRKL